MVDINSRITDINEFVLPLIGEDFKKIIDIANFILKNPDKMDLDMSDKALLKLSAYLIFIATCAGYFSARRRALESNAFINATGTVGDKEARAEIESNEARMKEEIFLNLFSATKELVNSLKKHLEIKLEEKKIV